MDYRTLAKIIVDGTPDEVLKLVETVLAEMKIKPKELDSEKHMIKGKSKVDWSGFTILIKTIGSQSVIEIYSNGVSLRVGPHTSGMIDPFYKKLSKLISHRPEMDVSVAYLRQEEIEATANESRASNNTSNKANSVADEIAKLVKLKKEGTLSEEEYIKMKNDLIDKM